MNCLHVPNDKHDYRNTVVVAKDWLETLLTYLTKHGGTHKDQCIYFPALLELMIQKLNPMTSPPLMDGYSLVVLLLSKILSVAVGTIVSLPPKIVVGASLG